MLNNREWVNCGKSYEGILQRSTKEYTSNIYNMNKPNRQNTE